MSDLVDELLSGKAEPPPQEPASPAKGLVGELLQGPQQPKPPEAKTGPERSFFEKTARFVGDWNLAAAQGATFGYSDEMAAWAGSQLGLGEYDELLGRVRERHKEIPTGVSLPGEIAGGIGATAVAAAVPIPGAKTTAGAKLAASTAKIPGWLKAMGFGGLFGGAYGSGTAEGDLADRGRAALEGAAVGAVASGVLHPVGGLIRKGAGAAKQQILARIDPEQEALRRIRQGLARDEISPGKLRSRMKELGPQATIADAAGENTRAVAQIVAGTPGPQRNRIKQILNTRNRGEADRIVSLINRGVKFDDYYAAEDAFLKTLRTNANKLYTQAYDKHPSLMTPELKKIIRGRLGRQAMKEAADVLETERSAGISSYLGSVDDELTANLRSAVDVGKVEGLGPIQPGVIKGFSLRTWDQIKRGFDLVLESKKYRNELTGSLNSKGVAVLQVKKKLLKELDKATGGEQGLYSKARKVYAGDAEVIDALRMGREALKKDPEIITREMGELSGAALESYRSGAARALKDTILNTKDNLSAASRIFASPNQRARLRSIFEPDDFQQLQKTLVSEQQFTQTKGQILGGSPTREKLSAEKDLLTKAGGLAALLSGSHGGLMFAAMRRKAGEAIFGPQNERFLSDIGKMLVSRNQSANQQAMDKIFQRMGLTQAPPKVKQEAASYIVPLIIGQQTGKMAGQ